MPALIGANAGIKQIDFGEQGYFMPLSSLQGIIYAFTPGSGAGGSFAQGSFSVASWASLFYNGKANPYLSSINGANAGLLKDMGKTVVSASRTFRKIQLVRPQVGTVSTGGVEGQNAAGATPIQDYLTGYIEMGFNGYVVSGGAGFPAPVAKFGM